MSAPTSRASDFFDPNYFGLRNLSNPRQPPVDNFFNLLSSGPDRDDEVLPLVSVPLDYDFDELEHSHTPAPSRPPTSATSRGGPARAEHAARVVQPAVTIVKAPEAASTAHVARATEAEMPMKVAGAVSTALAANAIEAVRPFQAVLPATPKRPAVRNAIAVLEETPPKRSRLTVEHPAPSPVTGSGGASGRKNTRDHTTSSVLVQDGSNLKVFPKERQKAKQKTSREVKSPKAAFVEAPSAKVKLERLEVPSRKHVAGLRELCLTEVPAAMILDEEQAKISTSHDDEPRIRPRRTRMPPVEFWRNERVLYERREGDIGFSVAGVLKNCAPHSSTDLQTVSEVRSMVQDPNVEKFQGMQPSSGIISNGVSTRGLATHMVVVPHWLKTTKKPPTVLLPIPSPAYGSVLVVRGSVRLAWGLESKYRECELHAGDLFKIPDRIETQFLAASITQKSSRISKGIGPLLKVIAISEEFSQR